MVEWVSHMPHEIFNQVPSSTEIIRRARAVDIKPNVGIWQRALDDISDALSRFNVILLLGSNDVLSRYRRSFLGQFWLTLSNALLIVTIGVVWAGIWKQPLTEFLPYLATGHVFWLLITAVLVDATSVFSNSASFMKELSLPRSIYIFANLVKNLIILPHNLIIIPVVFLFFDAWPSVKVLLFIPALLLTSFTLLATSFWLAVLGLRFRDVAGVISSLLMVMFFLTPVIWREEAIEPHLRDLLIFNPFYIFLELLRAPLLGYEVSSLYWMIGIAILILNTLLGFVVFAKWRSSLTYWL